MENITAVRPDMAVLDKNKLMLSPFGALSHALAEEILARTGQAEGVYPFVPLELLNEPEGEPEAAKGDPTVNVEVKLTLELTKEARELRERTETVERILERIERIRERGEVIQKPQGRERDSATPTESRSFFQNINQHISFPMTLSVPDTAGTAQPGGIARISEKFVNTLKTMREEGIYTEPGGETQRIADVGRGDGRTAGEQATGSGAASEKAERTGAGRTAIPGKADMSSADLAMSAAQTELDTSGTNVKSPEITARAAERIARDMGERAAWEIAEKLEGIVRQEAKAEGGAVAGRDGEAEADARNVDNGRGQRAREDIETGRPSMTRQREAQNREKPEITVSADGEGPHAALTGTEARTGEGAVESGGASPESRREAAIPESEERPSRAVPIRSEDRPVTPEDLTLAADASLKRSGGETSKAGREAAEDTRRAHGKEGRAEREDKSGAAPRRAGKGRARGRADEDTAEVAGETGTAEKAEGRGLTGETEKPGTSQRAGEEGSALRPGYAREGTDTKGPERAVLSREEQRPEPPEELSYRAGRGAAPEGEAGIRTGAEAESVERPAEARNAGEARDSGAAHHTGRARYTGNTRDTAETRDTGEVHYTGESYDTVTARDTVAAEAIPLRGGFVEATPEDLTLAPSEGTAQPGLDGAADTARGAAADTKRDTHPHSGETVHIDDRTGRPGRTSAAIGEEGKEGTSGAGRVFENSGRTGRAVELRAAEEAAPRAETAKGAEAGSAERPAEAIPGRKKPSIPVPQELAHRKEDTETPEGEAETRTGGEARSVSEARDAGKARDAEVAHDVKATHRTEAAHDAGTTHDTEAAHDTEEAHRAGKARDTAESYGTAEARDAATAEAIPLRGGFVEAAPEDLTLASPEGAAQPGGDVTAEMVRGAAADTKRDTYPHSGETVNIDGKTGRPERTSAAIGEDSQEGTAGAGSASDNTGKAGKTGEHRAAEGAVEEAAPRAATRTGAEAEGTERPAEAIPEHEMLTMPTPEELIHQRDTATPEGVAATRTGGETRSVSEARDAEKAREVSEARDSGAARHAGKTYDTGAAHDAEAAHRTGEARDTGESYDTVTSYDTATAEAIPLRGGFIEATPEDLTLAPSEWAAQPGVGRTAGTARGATVDTKRDTHPHSGETVNIDGRTGRPGRTSAAIGEEGKEGTAGAGKASENTGRAGRAVELRATEEAAPKSVTAKGAEDKSVERLAEAIPGREMPSIPVPQELAHRKEATATPEGGAVLGPGSTAK